MGITINLDLIIFALGSICLIGILIIGVGLAVMILYFSIAFTLDKIRMVANRAKENAAGVE